MSQEKEILSLRKKIEKLAASSDTSDVSEEAAALFAALAAITDMDEPLLRLTKIAFAVDKLRKSPALGDEAVKKSAKELLKNWQQVAAGKKKDGGSETKKKKVAAGPKAAAEKVAASGGSGGSIERDAPIDFEITAAPPKRNKHGK